MLRARPKAGVRASQVGAGDYRGIALATLPNTRVKWAELVSDYGKIRHCIEAIFPEFADFNNHRIKKPGGFRLYVAASERDWWTPTKRANFIIYPGTDEDPRVADREALTLTTIRSHDQYNTTIYWHERSLSRNYGVGATLLFVNEPTSPPQA